ncbi:hypothetical protein [Myceligenerans crystallogenes]|uniref:Uncharacterized protein n=1 Tax=Myceligenerans crystallogenes TaxID=316335 RepID=A0ABN2NL91_9MICO
MPSEISKDVGVQVTGPTGTERGAVGVAKEIRPGQTGPEAVIEVSGPRHGWPAACSVVSAGDAAVRAMVDGQIAGVVEGLRRRSRAGVSVVDVHEQFSVPISIAATGALVGLDGGALVGVDGDLLDAVQSADGTSAWSGAWAAGLAWAVAELVDRSVHRPRGHDLTDALLQAGEDRGPGGRARLIATIGCVAVAACATAVDVTDQTVAAVLDGSVRLDALGDDQVRWTDVREQAAGPVGACVPAHGASHACGTHSLLAATCAVLVAQRAPLLLLEAFPDMVPVSAAGAALLARPAGDGGGHLIVHLTGHPAP